jgi:acetoin utilization deacetylase AcuC-like enzyme
MAPLVYSPRYNITAFGLVRLHPFDSHKYRRIRDCLVRQGMRRPGDFVAPRPCTNADLLRVHTPDYLRSLRDRRALARILEVPARWSPAGLADCLAGAASHALGGRRHGVGLPPRPGARPGDQPGGRLSPCRAGLRRRLLRLR